MKGKKFLNLKVYENKRNGQGIVLLPRKKYDKMPKSVKIIWRR